VFARGLQHIDRFEWQGYPYSAYLYQIARGLCQRSYNQPVLVEIDDGVPSPVSGQVIAVQADQRLLWQRIAQLPPELQELFVLRFKDDLSYDDIAVIVQKSSGAIRTAISRGIKQLKTLYHYDT
jgi:RNA polymerase sigma-70 factor (ECF subfamily)